MGGGSSPADPLLGEMLDFEIAPDETFQILHSGGDHWITISTVGTEHPGVKVYDSLYNKLPWGTKEQIAALLQTEEIELVQSLWSRQIVR